MGKDMRILVVGASHAKVMAQQLHYYGVDANAVLPPRIPNPMLLTKYDVVYGVYLASLTRAAPFIKLLNKKSLIHIVGSDAYNYAKSRKRIKKALWNFTLNTCNEILFVREELKQVMRIERGVILPIPIDTRIFRKQEYQGEKRDILYYCPDPKIYRLEWIIDYAERHPDETVTIMGCPNQVNMPNVKLIPLVPYSEMLKIYSMHKRLVRMTTHDGYPKMPYEALLSGLEVLWNNQRITEVPEEMLMEKTMPKLISIIEDLLGCSGPRSNGQESWRLKH